jgi:hypothetical protein
MHRSIGGCLYRETRLDMGKLLRAIGQPRCSYLLRCGICIFVDKAT